MIVSVIITYNPDGDFGDRLKKIRDQSDFTVIVDNGSSSRFSIGEPENICVVYNQENLGVATALNQGISTALAAGATHVCLFDQDSLINKNFMNVLIQGFAEDSSVGIVAANYVNPNTGRLGYSYTSEEKEDQAEGFFPIDHAITSGSLVKIETFKEAGFMRDDLFIDYVDIEFCERVKTHNITMVATKNPIMSHSIGNASNSTILGYSISPSNHSPIRRYYMIRNCTRLFLENIFYNPRFSIICAERAIKISVVVALLEKNRVEKFKYIIRGAIDGVKNNMGIFRHDD